MLLPVTNTILSEILLIVGIFLVLYIIFKLGKFIIGLLVNTILGFIAIFIINAVFNIGIPWDWIVIVITAIFGLPGVAVVVVLKLIGITL